MEVCGGRTISWFEIKAYTMAYKVLQEGINVKNRQLSQDYVTLSRIMY